MAEDMVPGNVKIQVNENNEITHLNRVKEAKYFGVIFDHHMKWDKHIHNLNKINKFILFLFYKMKKFLHYSQLKTIYYAIFNSTNTYGILGWGGVYKTHINKLQTLQNRIINIIGSENDIFLNVKQTFYYFCIIKEYCNHKKTQM